MKNILSLIAILITLITVSACDNRTKEMDDSEQKYPLDNKEERRAKRGKITGEEGLVLFGGMSKPVTPEYNLTGGVNAYLWRASLDVISFMPLATADAVGGIIITDWYENSSAKGERMKANINISSKELRASGVKVSLFKQVLSGGIWRDRKGSEELARKLEDKILARAREIKIDEERK